MIKLSFKTIAMTMLLSLNSAQLHAKVVYEGISEGKPFQVELIAEDFSIPWGMVFHNKYQLLITQRSGTLKLLNLRTKEITPIPGIPVIAAVGQGGLLDIQRSPHYEHDSWLYFTYSKAQPKGPATTLARAKLVNNRLVDWQDLMISQSSTESGQHFGSRIAFDSSGHVFFGIGDRGERDNSQNKMNHAGSILRLRLDGSVPSDNPFINESTTRPEIWSYGHRNPQGLAFDTKRNTLWEIEHGPRGGDEINIIQAGKNYGWPVISYGKEYWGPFHVGEERKEGMEQPFKYYVPSIAPGSLIIYQGQAFPSWENDLFAGALAHTHLNRIKLDEFGKEVFEERLLEDLQERIRSLAIDTEGHLFLGTDSGKILRLSPKH